MELCSSGHEEVCYHKGNCPCCDLLGEIRDYKARIESLEADVATVLEERNDLQRQLDKEPVVRAIEGATQ